MLNAEQQHAVNARADQVVVVAGAGAGKTSTYAARVAARLQAGDGPVLAVTFTRAAAAEMAARVARLLGRAPEPGEAWIGTLHAWCWAVVRSEPQAVGREPGVSLWDDGEVEDAVRLLAASIGAKALKVKDVWRARLSTLIEREQVQAELPRLLAEANALTYDGLEAAVVGALRRRPELIAAWGEVLVDEHQDLSPQQADLLALLRGPLFAVGDPRQSIYGFRGSDPKVMLTAMATATVCTLAQNYRSQAAVVEAANALAAQMDGPTPGASWPPMVAARGPGGRVCWWSAPAQVESAVALVQAELAGGRAPGDVRVLAPTWATVRAVGEALTAVGVPTVVGRPLSPWTTPAGRLVRRALVCARNPRDVVAWAMLTAHADRSQAATVWGLRHTARDLGLTLAALIATKHAWAQALINVAPYRRAWEVVDRWAMLVRMPADLAVAVAGLIELLRADGRPWQDTLDQLVLSGSGPVEPVEAPAAVQLGTVHGAKGLEAPVVLVLDAHGGAGGFSGDGGAEASAEALRLLYVAATRARDTLHLLSPRATPSFGGRLVAVPPCPFLPALGLPEQAAPVQAWTATPAVWPPRERRRDDGDGDGGGVS